MKTLHSAVDPDTPPIARRCEGTFADSSRRDFVRRLTAGLCLPFALGEDALSQAASGSPAPLAQAAPARQSSATARTGSDVGSLWPFIESQAVTGEFPLSWLRPEFKNLAKWTRKARGKVLDLLHYSPAKREPHAELDRGGVGIVRRLRAVHVIVRMAVLVLALRIAEKLERAVRDDLVRAHVGRGAGAALDHVDDELIVELAGARRTAEQQVVPSGSSDLERELRPRAQAPPARHELRAVVDEPRSLQKAIT